MKVPKEFTKCEKCSNKIGYVHHVVFAVNCKVRGEVADYRIGDCQKFSPKMKKEQLRVLQAVQAEFNSYLLHNYLRVSE